MNASLPHRFSYATSPLAADKFRLQWLSSMVDKDFLTGAPIDKEVASKRFHAFEPTASESTFEFSIFQEAPRAAHALYESNYLLGTVLLSVVPDGVQGIDAWCLVEQEGGLWRVFPAQVDDFVATGDNADLALLGVSITPVDQSLSPLSELNPSPSAAYHIDRETGLLDTLVFALLRKKELSGFSIASLFRP
jgi:hypothetical protein